MPRPTARLAAARTTVLLAVGAAVLATGCGGDSGSAPQDASADKLVIPTPSVSVTVTPGTTQGLTLPIMAYLPSVAVQRIVLQATDEVTRRCMARFGFGWSPPSASPPPTDQLTRRYGPTDPAVAARYGYHVAPETSDSGSSGGKPGRSGPMSQAELLVLTGDPSGQGDSAASPGAYQGRKVPVGGCYGEGRVAVTGVDQIDPIGMADQINVEMFDRTRRDARVRAGFAAWSACMKRAGFDYPDPLAAAGDQAFAGGGPGQQEIRIATRDVACKGSTKLLGLWYSVESAYQKAAIQQKIQQLTEVRNRWTSAARKAAQILGVPAPPP